MFCQSAYTDGAKVHHARSRMVTGVHKAQVRDFRGDADFFPVVYSEYPLTLFIREDELERGPTAPRLQGRQRLGV